jgi:hypothetical protein
MHESGQSPNRSILQEDRVCAPVGFANSGGIVFVDESAEDVATTYARSRIQRLWVAAVRWSQVERGVWPVFGRSDQ